MAYHNLSECTLDADDREAEKNRIIARLETMLDELTRNEREFVVRIADESCVSVKQLFWLRDINNKY
jgi:C4-type Zn-finger protein